MRYRISQEIGHYHRTSFTTPSRGRLRRSLLTLTPTDSRAVSFKHRARIRWRGVCALWGFCYFPCRRGGGMINFWGDFTFFLFSLPPLPGCLSANTLPLRGFFYFGRVPWIMMHDYRKRLCTSVYLSPTKRPRPYSPPKGGGTAQRSL